jgi:predicted MPP superfamily phosphohydrolase
LARPKNISESRFISVYNNLEKHPTLNDVSIELDVGVRSIRKRVVNLRKRGKHLIDRTKTSNKGVLKNPSKFEPETEILRMKIDALETELEAARSQVLTSTLLLESIHNIKGKKFNTTPKWLVKPSRKLSVNGTPMLFISDIHADEIVLPSQVNGLNEYNREIVTNRLNYTFDKSINILSKMPNHNYDGFVLCLGGDLISGDIHDELKETNQFPTNMTIVYLTSLLAANIKKLADEFKKVMVVCVVGNHGRTTRKPRNKNSVFENNEWLIYQFLAREFENDDRVSFLIPESQDALFNVYDYRFLLTHGSQFRGGNAIAGMFSPIMRGKHKKQQREITAKRMFDVLLLAHFHRRCFTDDMIINGSVKGYDQFAFNNNFEYSPPNQNLWIMHQDEGIIFDTPIYCDGYLRI